MTNYLKVASQVQTLRGILAELRQANPKGTIKDSLAARYVLSQYHKYNTTDLQLCKQKDEVHFLAQTYLTYLQSTKNSMRIRSEYKGKGERSVQETADMVGFKLPHDPKHTK